MKDAKAVVGIYEMIHLSRFLETTELSGAFQARTKAERFLERLSDSFGTAALISQWN